jgi:hypothetical protein
MLNEEADVLVDGVLPQLVNAAVGLEARLRVAIGN